MIVIIITVWLVLIMMFLWMVHKLPDYRFGWWCIGLMALLIIYLPLIITISKIIPNCPPVSCPPVSCPPPQINWEQKYNEEATQKEEVFKKYPKLKRYFK